MEQSHFKCISKTIFILAFLLSHTKATPGPIPSLFDTPDLVDLDNSNNFGASGSLSGANNIHLGGDNGLNFDAALGKSFAVEKDKGFVAPPVISFKTTQPPRVSPIAEPPPSPPRPYVAPQVVPPPRRPCKRDAENAAAQQNSTAQHNSTAQQNATFQPNAVHQQHIRSADNAPVVQNVTGQQPQNVTAGVIIVEDKGSAPHHPHVRSVDNANGTQLNATNPQSQDPHQLHVRSIAGQQPAFNASNPQQNATNATGAATEIHFQHVRSAPNATQLNSTATVISPLNEDDDNDDDESDRKRRAAPMMMGNMGMQQPGNMMGNMQQQPGQMMSQQPMMSMGDSGSDMMMSNHQPEQRPWCPDRE
ncbi:hypothetical protein Ocin01_02184 [Orchesella cincta]|uniref:Uncharacterized protein n=1 Tax=Orchesella cincta TaxID=48709 RepID=A0A1D2NH12_ORCCI|nr:hypothetical protein Ocin01_02184 [Orchesella cincta]